MKEEGNDQQEGGHSLHAMSLEDLCETADMFRTILGGSGALAVMSSIRLRLVSKRMHANVIAAGYRPGNSIEYSDMPTGIGQWIIVYRSWTQSSYHIEMAFAIQLKYPLFLEEGFWLKVQAAGNDKLATEVKPHHADYMFCSWATHYDSKILMISRRIWSKNLLYAIIGALNHKGKWFLDWIVSEHVWDTRSIRDAGTHWIVAEYALRWDDADFLHQYASEFTKEELNAMYTRALACRPPRRAVMEYIWPPPRRITRSMKRKADAALERDDAKRPRLELLQ